jgi:hypothetical protein
MSAPSSKETSKLLVCCPDCRGGAAALAQGLYGHGADPVAGVFSQRIRFDLAELRAGPSSLGRSALFS